MNIRFADSNDYFQLAEMKWQHCNEDDVDYGEHNLDGVNKECFVSEYIAFLKNNTEYVCCVAEVEGVVVSSVFLHFVPKIPKPNSADKYIAYLTNVYTLQEYRNRGIGTKLLHFVQGYCKQQKCELIFAFPSENSIEWYKRCGFCKTNEVYIFDINKEL